MLVHPVGARRHRCRGPRAFTLGEVDQGVTDHVHALREGARGAHGVEPILEAERTASADDLGIRMEERFERLNIPLIDGTGIPLQKPPQLFVVVHRTATGLTGHPVPRLIRSGPMANRNSQRSADRAVLGQPRQAPRCQ